MTKSTAKEEVFRWVSEWEGKYMVSNLGNVMSVPTEGRNGVLLKPRKQQMGYLQVCLNDSDRKEWWYIHRLVATAFIPKSALIPNAKVVMHLDDNPLNNNVTNLQWGTQKMNMQSVDYSNRVYTKRSKKKYRVEDVKKLFLDNANEWSGKRSEFLKKIGEELGISYAYVNLIVYSNLRDWKTELV
jgi:hypothetical protein